MSEGCFTFHFVSLPLAHFANHVHKSGRKTATFICIKCKTFSYCTRRLNETCFGRSKSHVKGGEIKETVLTSQDFLYLIHQLEKFSKQRKTLPPDSDKILMIHLTPGVIIRCGAV